MAMSVSVRLRRTTLRAAAVACAWALTAAGCAAPVSLADLPADEHGAWARCQPLIAARFCVATQGVAADDGCVKQKASVYASRPARASRRRWLLSNGCSDDVIAGPVKVAATKNSELVPSAPHGAVTSASPPKMSLVPASAEPSPEGPHSAGYQTPASHAETMPLADGARCGSSAACASDLCVQGRCVSAEAVAAALSPNETQVRRADPVAAAKIDAPHLEAPVRFHGHRAANAQLRATLMVYEADLKHCVERQLKLSPSLRAEGMLVIDVDEQGKVPTIKLRGNHLTGSHLEACLALMAQRWRFPRVGQAYSVEAPVSVAGSAG